MKLFLTSSVSEVAHDIPNYVDLSKGNKLVFIDTAAEPEKDGDIQWFIDDRKALVNAGFSVTDYTITGKTLTELKDFLPRFDFIYMSGGNTLHLLSESYKSDFIEYVKELVKNGKIYIGTSAGSIVTGPFVPEYLRDDNKHMDVEKKPAYGLVNFTVVPHWGSKFFRKDYLDERLKTAYREDSFPYILLTNDQYIYVEDDMFRIIDLNLHK
jgi:dipeptidase E